MSFYYRDILEKMQEYLALLNDIRKTQEDIDSCEGRFCCDLEGDMEMHKILKEALRHDIKQMKPSRYLLNKHTALKEIIEETL